MRRVSTSRKIFIVLNTAFLIFMALICVLPLVNLLAISLSGKAAANSGAVTFWPVDFTTMAYQKTFQNANFLRSIMIAVARTVINTLLSMFVIMTAGYALSKDFKGRTPLMRFFVFTMLFSGGLIPSCLVNSALGLKNSFWVYTIPGAWREDGSGNLVYGSINEGNRKALERIAQWHANGWLFQEAAATGAWDAMGQFTEGKAGIFIGRPWAINSVRDVTTVAPDAVIAAYPNICQDNGEPAYQSSQVNDRWLMFNADFEHMDKFFEYYDWIYDAAFGTGDFQYGYLQDYDYDIVDDKVVFDSTLFDPPVTDPFMPGKSTVLKNSPALDGMQAYANVASGKEPETSAEIRAAADFEAAPDMAAGYALANEHRDELLPNMFNAEPTATMKRSWEQLQTIEKQVYTNIIYGNEPIEAFDKFVEDWKAQGGDQITQEVNKWYQSVK